MKHSLMHPAYPDLVGEWAQEESASRGVANDNKDEVSETPDAYLTMVARMEIAATRAW